MPSALLSALLVAACAPADTAVVVPISGPAPTLTKPPVRSRDGEGGAFDSQRPKTIELAGEGQSNRRVPIECPGGAAWNGSACVVTEVECPGHSKLVGARCIGEVRCPDDSAWDGTGCRPYAKLSSAPSLAVPPTASGVCALNVNSIPVAEVFLDGAALGTTPRMRASVTPGAHSVMFVASGHAKRTISFECRAGETKSVVAKLD